MSFAVFVHRKDSIYADDPARQYQFPQQYLSRVRKAVGSWVIFYEPTKVLDTRGYYAIARVADIISDGPRMLLARIEPGSYLEFPTPVSFKRNGEWPERGVLSEDGRPTGGQAAVRVISDEDFIRIVRYGLGDDDQMLPRLAEDDASYAPNTFDEQQTPFVLEEARARVDMLMSRPLRDRAFRKLVLDAYDSKCAITGLRFVNGGGRAEVAAAHIMPVERNGPDRLDNGLALSGTVHWMFDRGLLGITEDHQIHVSRHVNDLDGARSLINVTGRLIVPSRESAWPHPRYLAWHRENVFKA